MGVRPIEQNENYFQVGLFRITPTVIELIIVLLFGVITHKNVLLDTVLISVGGESLEKRICEFFSYLSTKFAFCFFVQDLTYRN